MTCAIVAADDVPGVSVGGGQGPGEAMKVPTLTIFCRKGRPPADDIFAYYGCPQPVPARSPCPGPGPRKRHGRRRALAGLLAVVVAAVIAGSRSFAAIGQWAADAGPEVLAVLGAVRGPAEESTFRHAFALAIALTTRAPVAAEAVDSATVPVGERSIRGRPAAADRGDRLMA